MPTLVSESSSIERSLWTADDFLDWLSPGVHADLIDGEKFMHSPVNLEHARLLNLVDFLLRSWLEQEKIGGELFREVVAIRLDSRNVMLPDLAWFSPDQIAGLAPSHAPFAPRWVCEVLSPRTASRDVGPKFAAYETSGVDEYWILDPQTNAHRFYAREGDYLVEFAVDGEWIESQILTGFAMRREWLNAPSGQSVTRCLEQLALR